MKHRVSELDGALLDAAVAMAAGASRDGPSVWKWPSGTRLMAASWQPSANWAQGGPIIERERISIVENGGMWAAFCSPCVTRNIVDWLPDGVGPTALTAYMRAFVASKFGDEIELP